MTLIDNPKLDAAFRYYCRHLVSLTGTYLPIAPSFTVQEEEKFFCLSGFVFSSHDRWFWTTAGHALRELDEYVENGSIELVGSSLVDSFHIKSFEDIPIPFSYQKSQRFYITDKKAGLDFGLIVLGSYYRDLLKANGIVPLAEENWNYTREIHFDHYIMLGLPQVFVDVSYDTRSGELISTVSPTMIYLEKTDYQPQDETTYPRFIAKIRDNCSLEDIKGMSGGPIFGFSNEVKDRYWIVAIQNSWFPESKIAFGCPISVFAPMVERIIDSVVDDLIV